MKRKSILRNLSLSVIALVLFSQISFGQNVVTYAGNAGKERFNAVAELSDGTVLVGGSAENLNWIPSSVPKTQMAAGDIHNGGGTGKISLLLQLSGNLSNILRVIYFPAGAAEEISFIKTTNAPGTPTGQIYISGKTVDSRANGGGYFIAKLNNNFVNGVPTALTWTKNVWATGDHQTNQPWDVGGDGKVVYASGEPFGANWAAVYRFKADGTDDVVENWRYHIGTRVADNSAIEGGWTPASSRTDVNVRQSAIIFKIGGRCDLRSWTQNDYAAVIPDGNGFTKQGKYPLDLFFSSPCDPTAPTTATPGYTGYSPGTNPTQRVGGIAVDRRNNHFYIGFAVQSRLPDGNPDFEPAVIAMTDTGTMKWWSRLYRETPDNSTPDQYVDGLAVDYSKPPTTTEIAVLARSHGNNVQNLWSGNSISPAQNPNNPGTAFHNTFTGTSGNVHLSWLGKLRAGDGVLMYSTYNAEYVDGATNFGAPYIEPIHDGWPSHNSGWANLNTTRCKTDVKLDLSGRVYLTCVGRRTITTNNAFQKMLKYGEGSSTWNAYVRVYEPNLKTLAYSSVLVGTWDATTGAGGDNTDLNGIFPVSNGVLVAGYHKADATTGAASGNPIPTQNVPAWGSAAPNGESAILAKLQVAAPPAATGARNRRADFDGDGKTDLSVFRPSNGIWYLLQSTDGFKAVQFGQSGDKVASEDYDNDGKTDFAVFRAGIWYLLKSSNNTFQSVQFGVAGDVPTSADFDGDGSADLAVFRPSNGTWYRLGSTSGFSAIQFGASGDIPAPGDFDGDDKADPAVFRPSNGAWYILNSSNNAVRVQQFGLNGDQPVAADYDGDKKVDVAVFRPSNGIWYVWQSSNNSLKAVQFGANGDVPTPGDYDRDGRADWSVYRNGIWFVLNSSNNAYRSEGFGLATDTPIPGVNLP